MVFDICGDHIARSAFNRPLNAKLRWVNLLLADFFTRTDLFLTGLSVKRTTAFLQPADGLIYRSVSNAVGSYRVVVIIESHGVWIITADLPDLADIDDPG